MLKDKGKKFEIMATIMGVALFGYLTKRKGKKKKELKEDLVWIMNYMSKING